MKFDLPPICQSELSLASEGKYSKSPLACGQLKNKSYWIVEKNLLFLFCSFPQSKTIFQYLATNVGDCIREALHETQWEKHSYMIEQYGML